MTATTKGQRLLELQRAMASARPPKVARNLPTECSRCGSRLDEGACVFGCPNPRRGK